MSSTPASGRPELRVAEVWDASIENTIRKLAYGAIAGAISGVVLFRAPAARFTVAGLGAGIGIGMGYTECKYEFDTLAKEQSGR